MFEKLSARIKGWRTILIMSVMGVIGSIEAAFLFITEVVHSEPKVLDVLPDWAHTWFPILMAVMAVYMRKKTTTPLGKKS